MAIRAERMALDLSEISELLTYTLCALRYALCIEYCSTICKQLTMLDSGCSMLDKCNSEGSEFLSAIEYRETSIQHPVSEPVSRNSQPDLAFQHPV